MPGPPPLCFCLFEVASESSRQPTGAPAQPYACTTNNHYCPHCVTCQVGLHGGAAAAAAVSEAAGLGAGADRGAFCLKGSSLRMRAKRDAIYK